MEGAILLIIVLVAGLLILLASGIHIAVAFLIIGTAIILMIRGPVGAQQAAMITWSTVTSEVMITIPLFVLMGEILFAGGLGTDLFEATSKIFHKRINITF